MSWTYGAGFEEEFRKKYNDLPSETQQKISGFLDGNTTKDEIIDWLVSSNLDDRVTKTLSYKEEFWEIILWNCTLLDDEIIERLQGCDPYSKDAVQQRNIRLMLPEDLRNLHALELFEKVIDEKVTIDVLEVLADCPSSAFTFNKNIAEAVALDSRVSGETLKKLCSHSSVEVRRSAKKRIDGTKSSEVSNSDEDFATLKVEISNEPSGSIMFGRLDQEELDLLRDSFDKKGLAQKLLELANNPLGRFVEYEGTGIDFRSDEGFHFGDLSPLPYNPFADKEKLGHKKYHIKKYGFCPVYNAGHIGPEIIEDCDVYDEEQYPIFEDGAYFVSLNLFKCSRIFDYIPYGMLASETSIQELVDEGEICEHYIPVRLPKCVEHPQYGHPGFGIVLDLSFKETIIEEYRDSESRSGGHESVNIFFVVYEGNDYLVFSELGGIVRWEESSRDVIDKLSSTA
jgi:hypothetical protein